MAYNPDMYAAEKSDSPIVPNKWGRWFQNDLTIYVLKGIGFCMTREPRFDAPGDLHHVMGRGIDEV